MEQPDVVSSRAGTPAGLAACLPAGRQVDRLRGEHGIGEDSAGGRAEFEDRMEGELGEHHAGELRRESAELLAERIIAEELRRQGWTEADLGQRRKR